VRRVRDILLRGGVSILGVLLNGKKLDANYYEYRYLNYGDRAVAIRKDEAKQTGEAEAREAAAGRSTGAGV